MDAVKKPILCLDFDGVLHAYTSGWQGADVIPDGPVLGAVDFLIRASAVFEVNIYSTRSDSFVGRKAMEDAIHRWVRGREDVPVAIADRVLHAILFPETKPPAMVTLDDRAITFTGTFPSPDELLAFKTWQGK